MDPRGRAPQARSLMGRTFIDTNVFVYAVDPTEPAKHDRAREVLARLGRERTGVVSTQVVAEFVSVVGTKVRGDAAPDVGAHARMMLELWPVLPVGSATVALALKARERHGLSYRDAQILASAMLAGATRSSPRMCRHHVR